MALWIEQNVLPQLTPSFHSSSNKILPQKCFRFQVLETCQAFIAGVSEPECVALGVQDFMGAISGG